MKAIYIVKIGSHLNSKTTIEELTVLAKQSDQVLEVFKSRRGNFLLIKLNGNLVAYGFETQLDAVAYIMTEQAA